MPTMKEYAATIVHPDGRTETVGTAFSSRAQATRSAGRPLRAAKKAWAKTRRTATRGPKLVIRAYKEPAQFALADHYTQRIRETGLPSLARATARARALVGDVLGSAVDIYRWNPRTESVPVGPAVKTVRGRRPTRHML